MQETTAEWVEKAEEDYGTAKVTLEHGVHIVSTVCFHCQQCAEKYLKAFLQEKRIGFPRDHALKPLMKNCARHDRGFDEIDDDLGKLEHYAVVIRYPGAFATRDEAEGAFAAATRVRAFVRGKLGLSDEKKNDKPAEGDKA